MAGAAAETLEARYVRLGTLFGWPGYCAPRSPVCAEDALVSYRVHESGHITTDRRRGRRAGGARLNAPEAPLFKIAVSPVLDASPAAVQPTLISNPASVGDSSDSSDSPVRCARAPRIRAVVHSSSDDDKDDAFKPPRRVVAVVAVESTTAEVSSHSSPAFASSSESPQQVERLSPVTDFVMAAAESDTDALARSIGGMHLCSSPATPEVTCPHTTSPLSPWSTALRDITHTPLRTPAHFMPFTPKTTMVVAPTPKTKGKAAFKTQRAQLAAHWFATFNARAFAGALPSDMAVTWSNTLNTTAGRTLCTLTRTPVAVYRAEIELSVKVLDSEDKLQNTLCHEMCHAATWLLEHQIKPPHGPLFKKYAARAMAKFPTLDITTCHAYTINYKYQYQCQRCQAVVGRHSKSIDVSTQCCARCHGGRLALVVPRAADGTPAKPRKVNDFALFVKMHFAATQHANPSATHGDLMKLLSRQYKARGAAAPVAPTF